MTLGKSRRATSRGTAKGRSPFLVENPNPSVPRTSTSLYTKDLFKRSDKAVEQLKNGKFSGLAN